MDFVDPQVQLPGRTITVKAVVANPARQLQAGMFIEARLATEVRANAVVIPEDAITLIQQGAFVWVVQDNKASRRQVDLGVRTPGFVEVRSGVEPGALVVVGGLERLTEGAAVQPTVVERPPARWSWTPTERRVEGRVRGPGADSRLAPGGLCWQIAPRRSSPSGMAAPGPNRVGSMLTAGTKAPAFTLPADDGTTVSLKDLKGKPVVLYFYPKDDTSGCTTEACEFRDNWKAVQRRGAVVLGVSPDGVASHQKFKAEVPAALPAARRRRPRRGGGLRRLGRKEHVWAKVLRHPAHHVPDRPATARWRGSSRR